MGISVVFSNVKVTT